ncbi:TPA: hypothetical protein M2P43_005074 [Klebsiella variicola]|nr:MULTISPECIES: hypothetical protein [Klebsiella]MBD0792942.1 hypothetical protein [Klebsiella sp. K5]HCI5690509.1 hypothetical protein [Klebsiella variicola subsp. variicola]HDZ2826845.1 hypothetical protein [Klebsiella pneumoniae]EIY5061938.1 hypothetical protein [Klebsiella variicola]EIY5131918.1 hypothetical protein [Klebsiella variicola]
MGRSDIAGGHQRRARHRANALEDIQNGCGISDVMAASHSQARSHRGHCCQG